MPNSDIVHQQLKACMSETLKQIDFLLNQELQAYTVHEGQFLSYKSKFLGYYQRIMPVNDEIIKLRSSMSAEGEAHLKAALESIAKAGLPAPQTDNLANWYPIETDYQNAFDIIAGTQAHYHSEWIG
jgi:hypothetical protein